MHIQITHQDREREVSPISQTIRYVFLIATVILPFVIQKAVLSATNAGCTATRVTSTDHLILPTLLLPIAYLPLNLKAKWLMGILLVLIMMFAFSFFTLGYSCSLCARKCF